MAGNQFQKDLRLLKIKLKVAEQLEHWKVLSNIVKNIPYDVAYYRTILNTPNQSSELKTQTIRNFYNTASWAFIANISNAITSLESQRAIITECQTDYEELSDNDIPNLTSTDSTSFNVLCEETLIEIKRYTIHLKAIQKCLQHSMHLQSDLKLEDVQTKVGAGLADLIHHDLQYIAAAYEIIRGDSQATEKVINLSLDKMLIPLCHERDHQRLASKIENLDFLYKTSLLPLENFVKEYFKKYFQDAVIRDANMTLNENLISAYYASLEFQSQDEEKPNISQPVVSKQYYSSAEFKKLITRFMPVMPLMPENSEYSDLYKFFEQTLVFANMLSINIRSANQIKDDIEKDFQVMARRIIIRFREQAEKDAKLAWSPFINDFISDFQNMISEQSYTTLGMKLKDKFFKEPMLMHDLKFLELKEFFNNWQKYIELCEPRELLQITPIESAFFNAKKSSIIQTISQMLIETFGNANSFLEIMSRLEDEQPEEAANLAKYVSDILTNIKSSSIFSSKSRILASQGKFSTELPLSYLTNESLTSPRGTTGSASPRKIGDVSPRSPREVVSPRKTPNVSFFKSFGSLRRIPSFTRSNNDADVQRITELSLGQTPKLVLEFNVPTTDFSPSVSITPFFAESPTSSPRVHSPRSPKGSSIKISSRSGSSIISSPENLSLSSHSIDSDDRLQMTLATDSPESNSENSDSGSRSSLRLTKRK